jgi:hypothetical protein
MSFSQPFDQLDEQSGRRPESASGYAETGDANSANYDDSTVDCYRRRNRILSDTHRTEWWMAIAVLLLMASVAFVVL